MPAFLRNPHVARVSRHPALARQRLGYHARSRQPLASNALEDVGGALGHNRLELGETLDEQESRKAERADTKPPARHGEHMLIVPSREDIHVPQRE